MASAPDTPIDSRFRIVAGAIGLAGAGALVTQVALNVSGSGVGVLVVLWGLAGFFTILTNLLVTASFLVIAATGRRLPYDWMSTLTTAMILVAVVYHLMLADLYNFTGLNWLTDQMFHTIMPALTLWFWLMETTRNAPRRGRPLLWLIWPALFAAAALARGAATGWYPYPFLNPVARSWEAVGLSVAGFVVATAALAVMLHAIGQAMPLRSPPTDRA